MKAIAQPILKFPNCSESGNRTALETSSAGAMPKETTSAMESNSCPKGDSWPPKRASRPSSRSKIHDAKMSMMAFW